MEAKYFLFCGSSKYFHYYINFHRKSMENDKSASWGSFQGSSEQLFHCPCGKAYRSYPALFTHIKNKHQGKAPGVIKKPQSQPKRRGRPPVHKRDSSSETSVTLKSETDSLCFFDCDIQQSHSEAFLQMDKISDLLQSLSEQRVNGGRLSQIRAILEMNVYLMSVTNDEGLKMGKALREFLMQLSSRVEWRRFQQMFTLLMLLLQFTMDSLQKHRLLGDELVDQLCDHINAFVHQGLADLIKHYEIDHLSIFQPRVMLPLFQAFFNWLKIKKFTNYRITLNSDFVYAI